MPISHHSSSSKYGDTGGTNNSSSSSSSNVNNNNNNNNGGNGNNNNGSGTTNSTTNNGTSNSSSNSSSYYPRSIRDSTSDRGRDRDKEWSSSSRGREWRRGERERSREREKERQRSPSRNSRFTADYNSSTSSRDRDRRQQDKYYTPTGSVSPPQEEQSSRRVSRFSSGAGKYSSSDLRSVYSSQTPNSSYSTVPTATSSLIREKDLLQNPGLTSSILHGNQYGSYHFSSHTHFADLASYSSLGQKSTTSSNDRNPKDDPLFKAAVDTLIMNMKTKGDYDQVRKECFSDIDTKAAFINLHARIKTTVDKYLGLHTFSKDMDKVKAREGMRKKILETPYFEKGIESVVNQILTPKIASLIRPKVEEEVFKYLKVDHNGGNKNLQANNELPDTHMKHERIETREIMPNSPLFKDVCEKPKLLLSKIIGLSEAFEDTPPSPPSQEPYHVPPPAEHSTVTRDSSMSESLSEKSLEIDLDARSLRSESMDESTGTTRTDEGPPSTPPEPDTPSVLPDIRVPPPPPPISTPPSLISTNVGLPNLGIAPPYGAPVAFAGHISHFGLNVLPPAHSIMEHGLSLGSIPHTSSIPPPLPPLPPSGDEHPPPPPSPPKSQIPPPPPPPMCDDDACSSPPDGSKMLISNEEEDEPLPPGEEPDSYFSEMRSNRSILSKVEEKHDMPPPPPPPEPEAVDLESIKLPDEDSEEIEELEEEEEIEEEDSEEESPMFEKIDEVSPVRVVVDSEEEESPMFEKICEVSPPRPVELQNNPLVQELRKELLGVETEVETNEDNEGEVNKEEAPVLPERRNSDSCTSNECKYLESIPDFDYKVSFYKRIPDS